MFVFTGTIARKSEEKRQNVLAWRENSIRTRKTEEKLRRDEERLSVNDKTKKENYDADKIKNSKDVSVAGGVLSAVSM